MNKNIIPYLDHTSLNDNDDERTITHHTQQALNAPTPVAAICIFPTFIPLVKALLQNSQINIATVANFPSGTQSLTSVLKDIEFAKSAGANEIDIVMPYQAYLNGNTNEAMDFIQSCKQACDKALILKVILETGALQSPSLIKQTSLDMIAAGADFLKTSTGKHYPGASIEAATLMLNAIRASGKKVGFKASGAIRTLEQANAYIDLTKHILGPEWVTPNTFRLGTSSLLTTLCA